MKTSTIRIVDYGRGPQIEGHRLTVMDVFYYLHRGRDFDFIHRVMPTLSRDEFDAVVEYVNEHHDELVVDDRLVEERIAREIAEQRARGLGPDESLSPEERMAQLRKKLMQRKQEQAERNGDHPSR